VVRQLRDEQRGGAPSYADADAVGCGGFRGGRFDNQGRACGTFSEKPAKTI